MRIRFFGRSDTGRKRTSNEDSFVLCEEEGLGVVCDGMGGHESGEVASRMAVDILSDQAARFAQRLKLRGRKHSHLRAMAQEFVVEWTQAANSAIHERGNSVPDLKGRMGTTLAMVLFVSDFVVVAHVGDSRVYRARGPKIQQLTKDHIVIADAKRAPSDPRPPRKRKYVTKALGTKADVEPDVVAMDVSPGDVFVLCSDGLTDLVTDEEICEKVGAPDRRQAVRGLIDLANRRGGTDNVTVVVAEVLQEEEDLSDATDELPIIQDLDSGSRPGSRPFSASEDP
jgi:PPM family protein phosphatase